MEDKILIVTKCNFPIGYVTNILPEHADVNVSNNLIYALVFWQDIVRKSSYSTKLYYNWPLVSLHGILMEESSVIKWTMNKNMIGVNVHLRSY